MKKFFTITGSLLVVVILIRVLTAFSEKLGPTDDDKAYRDAFARNYKIFSVDIPETLDFAGEKTPLDKYWVRESLDRELLVNSYWHSNTILMVKRTLRWFPLIKPILQKNKIPDDFIFLCMAESSIENVVSPAGAGGFWQIMKATGQEKGLEINSEVDERYNVIKATEAACRILNSAYSKYKNWTLAAASYNMGSDALDKQLSIQKTDNYYDLNLNRETLRYIYRILAIKTIFMNPVHYGYYLRKKDFYPPVPTQAIAIDTTIADLADFAKKYSISYRVLKDLNPWLLKSTLTNKERKKYEILIPQNGEISYRELMKSLEKDSILFNDTLRVDLIK